MVQILFPSVAIWAFQKLDICRLDFVLKKKKDDTGLERGALGVFRVWCVVVVCGHLWDVCIVRLYIRPKAMHTVQCVWLYKCIWDVHLRLTQVCGYKACQQNQWWLQNKHQVHQCLEQLWVVLRLLNVGGILFVLWKTGHAYFIWPDSLHNHCSLHQSL